MNASMILNNIKTSYEYIQALKDHLSDMIWEAIDKAEAEYKELHPDYHGVFKYNIDDCCRAPFGRKMTPEELYNQIKSDSKSTKEFVEFREDVLMGRSHYYKISVEYIKIIAKHLGIND